MVLSIGRKVEILYESLWIYRNAGQPGFEILTSCWTKKNILSRYLYSVLLLLKKIIQMRSFKQNKLNSSMMLYVNSSNTLHSLNFLSDQGIFFSQVSSVNPLVLSEKGKITVAYSYSLLSILQLPFAFLYYTMINPKFALKYPDFFVENWGKLEWNIEYLIKQQSLRNVVFSNDHNVQNRLFLHACKILNIHTSYIQHASVSKYFPPLNFDISFLYGKVDFEKYLNIGGEMNKIELVGIPSFDSYIIERKKIVSVNTIGISFNIIDDSKIIEELALYLANHLNIRVIIRPHPRDIREMNIKNDNISYSDAHEEDSFSYLRKIELHIAGDSSIHLESVLMNVPSFYYKMSLSGLNDYYEFAKNGMVDEVKNKQSFECLIKKVNEGFYSASYKRAKVYCESIESEWEGRVSERIKGILGCVNER